MRRLSLLAGLALALSLVTAGPASAQSSGEVRMTMHTHSNPDPNWSGLMFPTDRLSWQVAQGENFGYSSRTCEGNAPFNDVGLNFIPDYPGIDDDADHTAKVRYGIQGTVTHAYGDRGVMRGRVAAVVCAGTVPSPHTLVFYYTVQYQRISNNALQIWGGFEFSPTESTGTFRDIRGGGRMEGRFTCLGHQSNPANPSCAQLGYFTDFVGHTGDPTLGPGQLQPGLVGSFYDPTVTTRTA